MDRAAHLVVSTPRSRWRQVWPFAVTFVLALGLSLLSDSARQSPGLLLGAAAVTALTVASILAVPWPRVSEWWTLAPVAGVGLVVHLLRDASGGGTTAGFGSLLLLPVVWQALHRRDAVMAASIAVVTGANVTGIFLLDSPASTAAQWRAVVLFAVTAAGVGWTINRLSAERNRLLGEVDRLASHDPLTGLQNRRAWDDLAPALALIDPATPTSVAMIDLDRFKAYNDEHGHEGGDRLLVAAAEAWRQVIRDDDLLVRWGGEEFALLLPSTDGRTAQQVLERLQAVMPFGQTFSAGVALHAPTPTPRPTVGDLAEAVARADEALYRAKGSGRARVCHADQHEVSLR